MAALNKQEQELEDFLKGIGISPKGRTILIDQGIDEGLLRKFDSSEMKNELIVDTGKQPFKVPFGDISRLIKWKQAIEAENRSKKSPKGSPNRTKKASPKSPKGSQNRTKRASPNGSPKSPRTSSKSPNRSPLGSPPKPSAFYRQSSVSHELLTELATNSLRRKEMDDLMREMDLVYRDEPVFLHRHQPRGFYSDLKDGNQSIYYRWDIKKDGRDVQAFHLSLNHTQNELHENRTGFARDVVGALHVRVGVSNGPFRRILINLINGIYEITVCIENTKYMEALDPVAREIIQILVKYYNNTGRTAIVKFDNRRGPGRKERRC